MVKCLLLVLQLIVSCCLFQVTGGYRLFVPRVFHEWSREEWDVGICSHHHKETKRFDGFVLVLNTFNQLCFSFDPTLVHTYCVLVLVWFWNKQYSLCKSCLNLSWNQPVLSNDVKVSCLRNQIGVFNVVSNSCRSGITYSV